ncbi:MAG: GntR family transcriptional regulator [Planctomycetota bacterium]|jgi:GntR family transcriptional regulator
MNFPLKIDKRSGIPIYIQLGESIRLLIREGKLKPGDDLPTVRSLAVKLGINANTVARVYRELQTDGLLRLERGIGTFVAELNSSAASESDFKELEKRVVQVIKLSQKTGMSAAELSQFIQSRWQEINHV